VWCFGHKFKLKHKPHKHTFKEIVIEMQVQYFKCTNTKKLLVKRTQMQKGNFYHEKKRCKDETWSSLPQNVNKPKKMQGDGKNPKP